MSFFRPAHVSDEPAPHNVKRHVDVRILDAIVLHDPVDVRLNVADTEPRDLVMDRQALLPRSGIDTSWVLSENTDHKLAVDSSRDLVKPL